MHDIESAQIKTGFFAHCGVVVASMARVNMVWIMQCSHFLPKQMRLLFRVYEYTKEGFFSGSPSYELLTSNKNCVKVWNDGNNVYEMHYLTLYYRLNFKIVYSCIYQDHHIP